MSTTEITQQYASQGEEREYGPEVSLAERFEREHNLLPAG
jgi:hypothetical protein